MLFALPNLALPTVGWSWFQVATLFNTDCSRSANEEPDGTSREPSAAEASPDAAVALLRTLLGGAVEGADRILARLDQDRSPQRPDDEAEADRVRHALIGLVLETYGAARKGVSTAGRVASFGWSLVEEARSALQEEIAEQRAFAKTLDPTHPIMCMYSRAPAMEAAVDPLPDIFAFAAYPYSYAAWLNTPEMPSWMLRLMKPRQTP